MRFRFDDPAEPYGPLFKYFLEMNPFVDGDRVEQFNKGLFACLHGDWMIGAHLLVPQLENSIRNLMERSKALVTYLSSQLTQMDLI